MDQLYHSAKIPCLLSISLICIIQLEKKTCGVHQNYFVVQSTCYYLQVTGNGNYFISANSESSVGGSDWSKMQIIGKDTVAKSLGFPVNRVVDDLDFYISKDESYIITCPQGPICISYPKVNGEWYNGRIQIVESILE